MHGTELTGTLTRARVARVSQHVSRATAAHAPELQVRDTVNKYGRYATETKTITIKDLIKFHGHFCGGLVEGAMALRVAG